MNEVLAILPEQGRLDEFRKISFFFLRIKFIFRCAFIACPTVWNLMRKVKFIYFLMMD